jgi:hypothetical protein
MLEHVFGTVEYRVGAVIKTDLRQLVFIFGDKHPAYRTLVGLFYLNSFFLCGKGQG